MVRREIARSLRRRRSRVVSFDSLLMDFAEREGASMIVRGLRAVADFEYEYQMAGMNQQLNDRDRDRLPDGRRRRCSRSPRELVKEIALYGGDIGKFVTPRGRRATSRARVETIGRKGA